MNELSLFTGAGGGLLGTRLLGWRLVGCVESDPFCQAVLAQRMRDGHIDAAPIFGDARAFARDGFADAYAGMVDVVTAGFPCPRFSSAARGRNVADDLWPTTAEIVRLVRPRLVFLENVTGILARGRGFSAVLGDLAALGYNARWACISAADVGAPHERPRVWVLARHADSDGKPGVPVDEEVAGLPSLDWSRFPDELRMGDGLAHRVDRLRALGNGQVPAVVALAWRLLR